MRSLLEPDSQSSAVSYVAIGPFTRDYQIGARDELFFEVGGPGVLGGGAAWAMASMSLWDRRVGVVSRISPTYPESWIRQIELAGIDTRGLGMMPDVPAELVFGRYFENGEREAYNPLTVFQERGLPVSEEARQWGLLDFDSQVEVIRQLSPTVQDIPQEYLSARAFHIAPMPWPLQIPFVQRLREHSIFITLDPGPHYMRSVSTDELAGLLANVDVFMPSEGEVYSHFGLNANLEDCARQLAHMGAPVVVIKRGTQGSIVYERATERVHRIPIYPARTTDATGAGDSYCGGFLVGLIETGDLQIAARYGTVSASFAVESWGALPLLDIEPSTVQERLRWLESHTTIQ